MTDANNPVSVARNMIAMRGKMAALDRVGRYLDRSIRSEEPREFWEAVKIAIEED